MFSTAAIASPSPSTSPAATTRARSMAAFCPPDLAAQAAANQRSSQHIADNYT